MEAVWNYNTIVDRKRWGVGNTITSSPYGPHGEHPERWRANGSFPFPLHAPVSPVLNLNNTLTMHVKVAAAGTHLRLESVQILKLSFGDLVWVRYLVYGLDLLPQRTTGPHINQLLQKQLVE